MQNVRVGLSICVAGVATTNRVGHAYTKKVWHCPVLVKVGHIRRPKADALGVALAKRGIVGHYAQPMRGKLSLHGRTGVI